MNVPNITQGPGSIPPLPRAAADGGIPAPAHTDGAAGRARVHAPAAGISLTRLAWFDANGDGLIDPRAAGAGGDATLLVPTHEVDLPTWGRPANPVVVGPAAKSREAVGGEAKSPAVAANAAQTQRAVDAYQRYGQTPAAAAPTPDPLPAVNVTPQAAPITLAAAPSASPDLAPTATATPERAVA